MIKKRNLLVLFLWSVTVVVNAQTLPSVVLPAGSIVVNGGFESGFGGWNGTYGYLDMPGAALEGNRAGVVTDVGSSSVGQPMWQTLSTVPGAQYHLSFSLLSGYGRAGDQSGNTGSPVNVYWGGSLLGGDGQYLGVFSNTDTTTWKTWNFDLTASTSSTLIQFIDYTDMHWQLIDAVSVVPVPEPAVLSLVFGSLAILGLRRFVPL